MSYTEKWAKTEENTTRELHMEVQERYGIELVEVEASLFRVMLAEMGWMPLTDTPRSDRLVNITDQ